MTQNGKAAKCVQDARLTVKMGRCNAGVSEVKVWVQRWNVSGFKEKNIFQFGLHSKNEISVLPLNLIFYFLKLFNSAVKFEGVIRILHLFLKCI